MIKTIAQSCPFLSNLLKGAAALLMICAVAQAQPASQPATQPGRGARAGRGPVMLSPRDALPFSNSKIEGINPALPTLFIAGDSTAATGDPTHRGWAGPLVDYFDTDKINVVNLARGGRSFRTFVKEGLWDQLMAGVKPGDFVMIQFGHNDGGDINAANGRPDLPGIGDETQDVKRADGTTETVHTFGWYARKFANDVKAKGATPVFMTSTTYNRWRDGTFLRAGSRVPEIKQVAEQEKVMLVDHTNIISDRYQSLGQEAVGKLYSPDNLHTTTFGAIENAELFVSGIKALNIKPLVDALNDKGKAIAPYKAATTQPK